MSSSDVATVWADLDDACLSAVFSALRDTRSLLAASQINRRARNVSSADILWQSPFAADFPSHYEQLKQREGAAWRRWYRERHLKERKWQAGTTGPAEPLIAHTGPVFSTRFLAPPFPRDLALSGGVFGQNEASEIMLWELGRCDERSVRQGWRLVTGGMRNLCGIFDLRQIPERSQVVCCGFSPEINVASVVRKHLPGSSADSRGGSCANSGESQGGWALHHTHTLVGHEAACPAAAANAQGLAATASFDGTLRLWQIPAASEDGKRMGGEGQQEGPGGGSRSSSRSSTPDDEPPTLSSVAMLRDPFSTLDNPIFHSNAVCGVALAPDGSRLASGGNDMQVKCWDVESGKVALRLAGHQGWVWHVEALDDAHQVLVSAGTDSSVRTWDVRAGQQVQRVDVCTETLYPIAGLCPRPPDQRYIVCGVFDGSVRVVDRRQMRVLYWLGGHQDRVTRVCCDGDRILSGSFDSQVQVWTF